jgi:hypothetical protein
MLGHADATGGAAPSTPSPDQPAAARTLKEPLLPDLDVATQYVAGQGGLRVGGDWYGLREGR